MRAPALGIALFGSVLAAACGPGNVAGPGTVVAPTDSDAGIVSPQAVASGVEPTKQAAPSADAGAPSAAKLCGCSLCEPLVSDDACSADADCAPSALCHAEACIAKAKAPQRTKDTTCTMILKCGTADANACGCVQGKCALSPRAKP